VEQRLPLPFLCEVVEVVEMKADFDSSLALLFGFPRAWLLQIPREEFGSQPRPVSV